MGDALDGGKTRVGQRRGVEDLGQLGVDVGGALLRGPGGGEVALGVGHGRLHEVQLALQFGQLGAGVGVAGGAGVQRAMRAHVGGQRSFGGLHIGIGFLAVNLGQQEERHGARQVVHQPHARRATGSGLGCLQRLLSRLQPSLVGCQLVGAPRLQRGRLAFKRGRLGLFCRFPFDRRGADPEMDGRRNLDALLLVGAAVDAQRDPLVSRGFDEFVREAEFVIEPVTETQARLARQAYADFGKGRGHPAGLNFGDCLSYALALDLREPLLWKGDDFGHTGIRSALDAN